MIEHMSSLEILAAVVIGVLSAARTARLLIHDTFPPIYWLRLRWFVHVTGPWADLMKCQFCIAPYLAAGMGLWFWLGGDHWSWWVINGWWAASYLVAMVVSYDQPPEPEIHVHNN